MPNHHHYCEIHPQECYEIYHRSPLTEVPEVNAMVMFAIGLIFLGAIGGFRGRPNNRTK